ncbi:phosphatase [Vibrio virus vB_VspP_SBP1]|uniref:Phosphatase n=1 Tax=Vibrio virus vB_VspP_SBP1 TaxID=2500581 RepID=A0A3T0IIK5_9CAUD|nr:phosphatase [Vibrio virus vB_VspP_SBP1]AZU99594.1 phosphatase [Vibrio virus vB_VspP_SBP1]
MTQINKLMSLFDLSTRIGNNTSSDTTATTVDGTHQQGNMETMEQKLVIFDLDNTLRDNKGSSHMIPCNLGLSMNIAANWAPWQAYVNENSKPIEYMCELYASMVSNPEYLVYIVTSSSFGTLDWLDKHHLPDPDGVVERAITNDSTPTDYKKNYIDINQNIHLWVDDCPKICKYAREKEIKVLQVTHNYYEHQK